MNNEEYNQQIKEFRSDQQGLINRFTMNHTYDLCKNDETIVNFVNHTIEKQYIVYEEDKIDVKEDDITTNIIISKKRTYEAAKAYKNKKVAVLNFANNHRIGGGPWSANAQEESLCRCSTLYPCLEACKETFYVPHQNKYNSNEMDCYGNDDLIYSPDVVVFKTDESSPLMMEEDEWYKVDVITSAAPEYFGSKRNPERLTKVLSSRLEKVLQVAKKEGVEVLILGAYGCGAFCNPPSIVANIFKELLTKYYFETVEFAIYCRNQVEPNNYSIFRDTFIN